MNHNSNRNSIPKYFDTNGKCFVCSERISTLRFTCWGHFYCYFGQNNSQNSSHKFNVTIWVVGCFNWDLGQNSSYTSGHKFNVTIWFGGCFLCDLGQNTSYTSSHKFNVTIWFWAVLDTKIAHRNVKCFSFTKTIFDSLKTSIQRYDLLFVS